MVGICLSVLERSKNLFETTEDANDPLGSGTATQLTAGLRHGSLPMPFLRAY
jgi:hypothetical protein